LNIARGSIRATVLIETILAAFEMDEILWELRDHSGGLNCGRWDYIFSYIKKFRENGKFITPDRGQVSMTAPFMRAYVDLLIQTCHRRGIHAMGGMSAFIPIKDDQQKNDAAMDKVKADKLREVKAGHDGTWVAHPGLVVLAKTIFDQHMNTPNQIHVTRSEVKVGNQQLLEPPKGTVTEEGVRDNIMVSVRYIEAWLRGIGCVPLNNLMEDAATAEISRVQIWQWVRHGVQLDTGKKLTKQLVSEILAGVMAEIKKSVGAGGYENSKFSQAAELLAPMLFGEPETFPEFLTLPAYEHI